MFNDKLKSVESVTGKDAKDLATFYNDPEITEITKEVPAVFFDPNNLVNFAPPTDIWIEDPKNLDMTSNYIHNQVLDKLGEFVDKSTMPHLIAGYVLEDGNRVRYLVLDNTRASGVKERIKFGGPEELSILDVLNKYKISKVVERVSKEIENGNNTTWARSSQDVIGKSMLDKRREDIALINLARKHKMTNSQYLRLNILADSLLQAGKQVSLEELAQSIVKDPNNENISVKHLPFEEKLN